ncbi:MAG: hypothetical protein KH135_01965 [Firmicutes bacterium]|nr:hypothetical protein [Bacillota bacterium]
MKKRNNYLLQKILLSAGITLFTASGCVKMEEKKEQDVMEEIIHLETEIDKEQSLNNDIVEGTIDYYRGVSDSFNQKINKENQSREYQTGVSDEKIARTIATEDGKVNQDAYEKTIRVITNYQGEQFGHEKAYSDMNQGLSYSEPSPLIEQYRNKLAHLEIDEKYKNLGNEFIRSYVEYCEGDKMRHSMGISSESYTQEENINYLMEGFLHLGPIEFNKRKHELYHAGNSLHSNALYIADDEKSPIYQNALSYLSYKIGNGYGMIMVNQLTKDEVLNLEKISIINMKKMNLDNSKFGLLVAENFDKGYVDSYNERLDLLRTHTNVK